MRIWGVLCLVSCASALNAEILDISDRPDERTGIGMSSHFDEESQQQKSMKEQKPEFSSVIKGKDEDLTTAQQTIETIEPFLIVNTVEKLSPPGGGVRKLDPAVVNEIILLPFPEVEVPWWERWWDRVVGFFQ